MAIEAPRRVVVCSRWRVSLSDTSGTRHLLLGEREETLRETQMLTDHHM